MSTLPSTVNVKISYIDKIKRRNGVKSLDHLYQVIHELFHLNQKQYELSYTDNENDDIIIDSQDCFEAALYAVHNGIYSQINDIKPQCDVDDVRRKLVLLRIKINESAEAKYDDFDKQRHINHLHSIGVPR
eukprot:474292_1